MRVREIMTPPPVYCTPEMPLQYVIHMLIEYDCSALPVVENSISREPVGIVTGLGITTRMVTDARSHTPWQVLDVMASPMTVTPETSVAGARRLLKETLVRHLLVVDEAGECIGIVSKNALSKNGINRQQYG